jgi:peptidoglycan/LPS O-acetylase OafA/YrhL
VRKEIVPLTSLRGFAAMAVILTHYSATLQPLASATFPSLAPHGYLAVDIFFVLSGFIMAYTYLSSFQTDRGWASAYGPFLIKRVARILPLNVAVTILLVAAAMATSWLFGRNIFPHVTLNDPPAELIANALMLPGIGIGNSINWPAWSISVEFVAYLFFPIFIFGTFHARQSVFLASCSIAYAVIILMCLTGQHLSPYGLHNLYFPPWRDLGCCCSEFVLGMVVYRVYASGRYSRVLRHDFVVLGLLTLIAVIIALRLGDLFALLLFPPLILALSLNNGWIKAFMSMRIPHFLGVISFSLYLTHDNFRPAIANLIHVLHPMPLAPHVAMMLVVVCAVLMIVPAWICYAWIERPGRALIRKIPARITVKAAPGPTVASTNLSRDQSD